MAGRRFAPLLPKCYNLPMTLPALPQPEESIRLLSPDVAAKIAAGEVVERPANAAKELIENSLDAGADEVRVEVREGGRRLLRVSDNGRGIPSHEAPLAFLRHATSKLRTAEDLEHINSFGFRGEALYSIAAVSHTSLLTRSRDEEFGTLLRLEGGELVGQSRAGAPVGTVVTVENLFYNVPARQKFLRSPLAESGQIAAIVQRFALAWPDKRFSLVNDGKTILQTGGGGERFDVLAKLFGLETAQQMVPLEETAQGGAPLTPEADLGDDVDFAPAEPAGDEPERLFGPNAGLSVGRSSSQVTVSGYVGLPSLTRANRTGIQIFVNRRAVEDRSLTHAVVQAYHTLLPVGRFPVAIVLVEVPPEELDVNVHPQKVQVRFADERRVFHAVQKAVRRAVMGRLTVPVFGTETAPGTVAPQQPPSTWERPGWPDQGWSARRDSILAAGRQQTFDLPTPPTGVVLPGTVSTPPAFPPTQPDIGAFGEMPAAEPNETPIPAQSVRRLPPLRVVGQIGATYIVAEGPQGMYLIDQHAAHERILYEAFLQRRYGLAAGEPARQHLLEPVTLHAGGEVAGLVAHHLEELAAIGYEIESFGGDTFLVRAVPAVLSGEDPAAGLLDIVTTLGGGRSRVGEEYEAQLVKMVCKRAAIKAGQMLSDLEMQELVRQLEECESPRTCPHGRPTMIQLSAGELEKAFGRI